MRFPTASALLVILVFVATPGIQAAKVILVAGGDQPVAALPATQSKLISPFGIDFDSAGQMIIIEISGHRVLKVDAAGILTKIAGTGDKGNAGDGGPPLQAQFNGMHNVAIAKNGDIYLADTWNQRVRKIDARTGLISTIAGAGESGYSGDGGPATAAQCSGIYCVALDPRNERLYLADRENRRLRMVTLATGVITTVAGNGEKGAPPEGALAAQSPLVDPRAVCVDSQGTVYLLERAGFALRAIDSSGHIHTVAGCGKQGFEGDGGDAKAAKLFGSKHLCCDRRDNVIIADTDHHAIRKYLPREGKIVRVAGTGEQGNAGVGGPPEMLQLNQPHGVAIDAAGDLYIVDSKNHRVLKLVD